MAISDTGKADAQPLSPEVWEAQQQEIARLCQVVQAAEVENQGLRARVAELEQENENLRGDLVERLCRVLGLQETPQNPSICPVEPHVVASGGYSTSRQEYGDLCDFPEWDEGWEDGRRGRPHNVNLSCTHAKALDAYLEGYAKGKRRYDSQGGDR